MIRLHRPATPPTLDNEGKRATANLKRAYARGKTEFNFYSTIYGSADVRAALRGMHQRKCAFCENILPQITAGHVEHFRPKGSVQQDENDAGSTPGYYWLAYDWNNLLLACEWCNTRAKRKLFPLADPAKRARTHTDTIDSESPLLLNPANEDPAPHLEFVAEEIRARNGSIKGATSIRVYRLDDAGLTDDRRRKLHLFRTLSALARNNDPHPEVDQARKEAAIWTQRIQTGDIEYSAMLRENLP